ncbi:MAG TPA: hypothetical protein DEA96_08110 [Leptospiraceae bacterium]|nr:hypothetical protein [Spirochaetaceae bacterium]HBS04912.1 hypothetical protein [Leptospiraceae bacterium]
MGRWNKFRRANGLIISQLVIASFLTANAVPALHYCPRIGSVPRNAHSLQESSRPCHSSEAIKSDAHSDREHIGPAEGSTENPDHDHDVCPICQGYLSIQDLQNADSCTLNIYSEPSWNALLSPPITIEAKRVATRARDPPSMRFA